MNFRQLQCFVETATEKNFRRASVHLNLTPSALWRQIRSLEEDLAVKLFTRQRRGIILTNAGESLLKDSKRLLEDIQQTRERTVRVSHGELGFLRIGISSLSAEHPLVLQAIRKFRTAYPTIDLEVSSMRPSPLWETLLRGEIDGAFMLREPRHAADIKYLLIESSKVLLAVSKDHHLARRKKIKLADLKQEGFLMYSHEYISGLQNQFLTAMITKGGFTPRIIQRIDDPHLVDSLIAINVGVAFASGTRSAQFKDAPPGTVRSSIVLKQLTDLSVTTRFCFAWRDQQPSSALANFVTAIKNELRD